MELTLYVAQEHIYSTCLLFSKNEKTAQKNQCHIQIQSHFFLQCFDLPDQSFSSYRKLFDDGQ